MIMTYQNTRSIQYLRVRVSKEDSVFLYFILESNDNLCWYSTIPHEVGQKYRDIDIRTTIENSQELLRLLKYLEKEIKLEYLIDEIKEDA